jgi:hypothetical protein
MLALTRSRGGKPPMVSMGNCSRSHEHQLITQKARRHVLTSGFSQ